MLLARPGSSADPLLHVRRHLLAAAVLATAAAAWGLAGPVLPGGRWLAVHLLTLGVLTNLLVGLMPFFARTVLHAPLDDSGADLRLALLNGGAIVLLVGLPTGATWAVALGATALTAAVMHLWLDLRRARKRALPARFSFVGRIYERACGGFVHAALLGAAMGVGLIPGAWYAGVRLAHLHVALLGWVGLPLLATLLTLGPTILRTRMADGAGPRAATWLPRAATALTVGVLALAFSGAPAPFGRGLELLGAAGLAVYAVAVAQVCVPVLAVWRSRVRSLAATLMASACAWFMLAIAVDVALVATGATRLLDLVAPVLIVGVLVQAVLGSLLHLLPMAMTSTPEARGAVRERLAALPAAAAIGLNAGVLLLSAALVGARVLDVLPGGVVVAAWSAVAAGILLLGAAMAWACLDGTARAAADG
jgi:nitrite reductase (NO-forming)